MIIDNRVLLNRVYEKSVLHFKRTHVNNSLLLSYHQISTILYYKGLVIMRFLFAAFLALFGLNSSLLASEFELKSETKEESNGFVNPGEMFIVNETGGLTVCTPTTQTKYSPLKGMSIMVEDKENNNIILGDCRGTFYTAKKDNLTLEKIIQEPQIHPHKLFIHNINYRKNFNELIIHHRSIVENVFYKTDLPLTPSSQFKRFFKLKYKSDENSGDEDSIIDEDTIYATQEGQLVAYNLQQNKIIKTVKVYEANCLSRTTKQNLVKSKNMIFMNDVSCGKDLSKARIRVINAKTFEIERDIYLGKTNYADRNSISISEVTMAVSDDLLLIACRGRDVLFAVNMNTFKI